MATRWLAALTGLTLGVALATAAEPLFPAAMWTRLAPAASSWSADKLREADAAARAVRSDAVLVVHSGAVVHEFAAPRVR